LEKVYYSLVIVTKSRANDDLGGREWLLKCKMHPKKEGYRYTYSWNHRSLSYAKGSLS